MKFNIKNNYNNINNYYLPYNSRYQEPEPEQPVLTQSLQYAYNLPEEGIPKKNKSKKMIESTYIKRPFVIESK